VIQKYKTSHDILTSFAISSSILAISALDGIFAPENTQTRSQTF